MSCTMQALYGLKLTKILLIILLCFLVETNMALHKHNNISRSKVMVRRLYITSNNVRKNPLTISKNIPAINYRF